eukprot:scaffold4059_cov393-Prasinococcus_capsulatus_cf.AAC.8
MAQVTPYSDEGGVAASPVRAALYVSNWEVLCADRDLPAPAAYKAKLLQGEGPSWAPPPSTGRGAGERPPGRPSPRPRGGCERGDPRRR